MHKLRAALCCVLLLVCVFSCALAQEIYCPEARLTLTVPDSWTSIPLRDNDDPDLCLLLESDDVTLSVYVADAGGLLPDAFEVFTGDETESGTVILGGKEMTYVVGKSSDGDYRIYTWLDRRNQVQFYFLVTAHLKNSRKTIDGIMDSLVFE